MIRGSIINKGIMGAMFQISFALYGVVHTRDREKGGSVSFACITFLSASLNEPYMTGAGVLCGLMILDNYMIEIETK